jgi:RNA polymerase sigma factor (sigma-70 family)
MGVPAYDSTLETLITSAHKGDRAALEALLARIHPDVFRMCWSVGGTRELAEDSCQEALTAICVSIAKVRDPACFWGWAARIARRTAMRRAKRETQRRQMEIRVGRQKEEMTKAAEPAERNLLSEIAAVLPRLQPQFREIVELRGIRGLDYDAIATRLEISPVNARQRYSRAVDELRRMLGVEL